MKVIKNVLIILLIIIITIIIIILCNKHNQTDETSALNKANIEETTISIRTSDFIIGIENKQIVLKDETEINEIINIINNLDFSEETCDGLSDYILTINDDEEYGIEIYQDYYHITDKSKGEARLTEEQTNIIKEIISKYF